MLHQPDPAIVTAAVVCRMRYDDVLAAVSQHEQGFYHMPGTSYHDAVIAVRAVRHALEYHVSHSVSGESARVGETDGGRNL